MVRQCEEHDRIAIIRRRLLRLLIYRYMQLILRAAEAKRLEELGKAK
jgi:hypothetical protein